MEAGRLNEVGICFLGHVPSHQAPARQKMYVGEIEVLAFLWIRVPGDDRGTFLCQSLEGLLPLLDLACLQACFAEVVEWPQGENMVRYNLFTGQQTWRDRKPDGTKAEDGFRVVRFTRRTPPRRIMEMGVFNVRTSKFGLEFVKTANSRDKTFRNRGRP